MWWEWDYLSHLVCAFPMCGQTSAAVAAATTPAAFRIQQHFKLPRIVLLLLFLLLLPRSNAISKYKCGVAVMVATAKRGNQRAEIIELRSTDFIETVLRRSHSLEIIPFEIRYRNACNGVVIAEWKTIDTQSSLLQASKRKCFVHVLYHAAGLLVEKASFGWQELFGHFDFAQINLKKAIALSTPPCNVYTNER